MAIPVLCKYGKDHQVQICVECAKERIKAYGAGVSAGPTVSVHNSARDPYANQKCPPSPDPRLWPPVPPHLDPSPLTQKVPPMGNGGAKASGNSPDSSLQMFFSRNRLLEKLKEDTNDLKESEASAFFIERWLKKLPE
jgi:hypothetical protein